MEQNHKVELRKCTCPLCKRRFYVDCDDDQYPSYCPACGEFVYDEMIRSEKTVTVEEIEE